MRPQVFSNVGHGGGAFDNLATLGCFPADKAGMQRGFFYDFSNYGSYDRLSDDGLTKWHPAFLSLGESLDECAAQLFTHFRRQKWAIA